MILSAELVNMQMKQKHDIAASFVVPNSTAKITLPICYLYDDVTEITVIYWRDSSGGCGVVELDPIANERMQYWNLRINKWRATCGNSLVWSVNGILQQW